LPQSRAAKSREAAIHAACELLAQSYDVRRIIEPNGAFIERQELDAHYDEERFPGLRQRVRAPVLFASPNSPGLPA
jgi:TATA-box binding protein (TBP) (component of TFIID and TFIIIB)